jgi:two-component system, cell cycle sensor histidine kinase and response regulator CckA
MLQERWFRRPAEHAVTALLYLGGAYVGFRVAPIHPVVASVWPPAGFALAVLLLGGLRLWPGLWLGAFLANALHGIPLPFAAAMGIGNSLSAVYAVRTLRRLKFRRGLTRVEDVVAFLAVGALAAPIISASFGALSIHLSGGVPSSLMPALWLNWWSGDSIGIMLVTPLLAVWLQRTSLPLTPRRLAEGTLVLGTVLAVSGFVLGSRHEYKYALLLLVGWVAVRYGLRGATAAAAVVAMVALWYTGQGMGAFAGDASGLWRLQLFLALLISGSLVTAGMASAVRTSGLRFRRVFDSAGMGIALVQPDGIITQANSALHRMLGYSERELSGRSIAAITHPEDWSAERTSIGKVLSGQIAPYRVIKRYLRRDGTPFWGKLTATHVPDEETGASCAIKLIEDISDERAATQLLQILIDAAPLAIVALGPDGRVRSWNLAAEQMLGWSAEEVIGLPMPSVPQEEIEAFRASWKRVLAGDAIAGQVVRRRRRDGILLDLRICAAATRGPDGNIDGGITIAEDVTDRKRLGEQLKQAQKMEAIGELTGGIAHDFNNILTIVLTNAALVAEQLGADQADARTEVTELQRAALKGAELVRKLMTFSRRRDLELSPINLGEVLCETERALRRLLPPSVEVVMQVDDPGPFLINGDVGAIEQIVFNLATNARDAMPEGGRLRLALYRSWLDKEHRRTHGWGATGEYIVLAVSDTGCGMSPETRARVFEPFFTTKGPGKGTGLGMAMVYGLVKQHKSYIGLYSEPGHGTTFRLYFPALTTGASAAGARAEAPRPAGGSERILLVDDEDGLRRTAARVLRKSGYRVEEAKDGEAALELLAEAESPFDLVLSDVVMPRMGGVALYETIRKEGRNLPVLLMSGYTPEDVRALGSGAPGFRFLHKPWTITDLLLRIRNILDETDPVLNSAEA